MNTSRVTAIRLSVVINTFRVTAKPIIAYIDPYSFANKYQETKTSNLI